MSKGSLCSAETKSKDPCTEVCAAEAYLGLATMCPESEFVFGACGG